LVTDAREDTLGPSSRSGTDLVPPESLQAVPGTRMANRKSNRSSQPPEVDVAEVRRLVEKALVEKSDLTMVYKTRTGQSLPCTVQPQRLAFKADAPVLVGLDREEKARRTFMLDRIERLELCEPSE
ncbi:MAG: WYL domain-containing protein, partial [Myxococcota bacterium]